MIFEVSNETALPEVAKSIVPLISTHSITLFRGELGAGKTTLIKQLGKQMGVTSDMSSPSFGIVNQYDAPSGIVYHIDLYRIKHVDEIYEFGLPEILDSGSICLIEWPEVVSEIWQDYDCSKVSITIEKSGLRRIFVQ
ncbi:MAG: tRNA threonylcarbamoyladenosine biosynthesis protein TsaE [Bacteroidia bacterium]|jgi:tRNA threonylcarbamoyladenosine biosynthesis protein TsaE